MSSRKKYIRRTGVGFTLVELLIVIVVIGILSAMMMISSTEAIASAQVTAVLSNMRNMKTAITTWYLDNTDLIEVPNGISTVYSVKWEGRVAPVQEFWESRNTAQGITTFKSEIMKYMENPGGVRASATGWDSKNNTQKIEDAVPNGYVLEDNGSAQNRTQWFLGYVVKGDDRMKKKFAERAKAQGLFQENKKDSELYTNGDVVWMRVLTFE